MVFSDLHYDHAPDGDRRMEELLEKAREEKAQFMVSLGDLCFPIEKNRHLIRKMESAGIPVYHVLGNHDTQAWEINQTLHFLSLRQPFYSFVSGEYKFLVLDSCYWNQNGKDHPFPRYKGEGVVSPVIPEEEISWLTKELEDDRKYIIFSHHSLANDFKDRGIENREEVRKLFRGKRVVLCMNGHDHGDGLDVIDRIPYYTVNAALGPWVSYQMPDPENGNRKCGYLPYKQALHVMVELNESTIQICGIRGAYQSVTPEDAGLNARHWNGVSIEPRTSSYTWSVTNDVTNVTNGRSFL